MYEMHTPAHGLMDSKTSYKELVGGYRSRQEKGTKGEMD
jgi:hypothetical protein